MECESIDTKTLLVCTVGGSAEPIIKSIQFWRPAKVVFVASPASKAEVDLIVFGASDGPDGIGLPSGATEVLELTDEQNTETCVAEMAPLQRRIGQWAAGNSSGRAVVDFTGGTKCMSAAVAMVAARTPCIFSYVGSKGGAAGRDRGGKGIVKTGNEYVVSQFNPWKALGYEVYGDAALLFNQHLYAAAAERVKRFYDKLPADSELHFRVQSLWMVISGYARWDRFAHGGALNDLAAAEKRPSAVSPQLPGGIHQILPKHIKFLTALKDLPNGREFVLDLLANAERRAAVERYDDAVARLYRAAEALAQAALRERGVDAAAVTAAQLPEKLRKEWRKKFSDSKAEIQIGMRDDYQLLRAMHHPAGEDFFKLGLAGPSSPLAARNNSILAHGFEPVKKEHYARLHRQLLTLAEVRPGELPVFPCLPPSLDG